MNSKKTLLILFVLLVAFIFQQRSSVAATLPSPAAAAAQVERGPARPDRPEDAPLDTAVNQSNLLVGETTITYDFTANKARFKVDDGYDLDLYLFADSSPLDFYIDLQGFQPHPTEPALVTMRVWDVDQNGAPGFPDCLVEVDRVSVNGTLLGNLTGADSQWSIVTFSIPAGVLTSGNNHFTVDIDVLTGSCWAVEVDWAEIELPFNIAQVESSALNDITIRRGTSDDVITDPIWQSSFDASGNIVTPANPDDPIADKISGFLGFGARQFDYRYKIDTWPAGAQPTWEPTISYSWEIAGTGQDSGGFHDLAGWENEFTVTIPDEVGKYTLDVTLKIYRDSELLRTENRSHTLYAIWNTPPASVTVTGALTIATGQPRTAWLDVATSWANGQSTVPNILNAVNTNAYGNPLGWGYGYPKEPNPVVMIEVGGVNGDCFVFRDVWRVLAASLGISTNQTSYVHSNGFVTSTRPALDGNASANAQNSVTSTRDRWIFGNHQYGVYGGTFYDPTFGLTGANTNAGKEGNIFCKVSAAVPGGGLQCDVLNPPPASAILAPTAGQVNGWDIWSYTTAGPRPAVVTASFLEAAGAFTGVNSDTGYDPDGNGLFEHLEFSAGVEVTEAGNFTVLATLADAGGSLISWGSLDPDLTRHAPLLNTTLDVGVQSVPIYFNGFAIRTAGADGPYTVEIGLYDEAANLLDSAIFTTSSYDYQEFQGLLAQVQSLSDVGVDTDSTPGYDLLRLTAIVDMAAAADVSLQAQLFAGDEFLADVIENINLGAGSQAVDLDFPGAAIAAGGLDGPYTVYLTVSDVYYNDNHEHETAAYSYTDFQPPAAYFTGNVSDSGIDTNGNGLYEELHITAEAVALVAGEYTVYAILADGVGNFMAAADTAVSLGGAPSDVTVAFDGRQIYSHGANGPYQVSLVLVDSSGEELFDLDYLTAVYAYTDFEFPAAVFNDLFSDSGVDSDGDGYYNLLRVGVGVDVATAGSYYVDGSLHDAVGNFIAAAQVELFLVTGNHTINLEFDGAVINAHGVDGPYHLRALNLVQVGVGSMDSRSDAYQTAAYTYTQFQPSVLVLTGNFADFGQDTNGNGLYDFLIVEMELIIAQSATYNFNARLVDSQGEEIVWAAHAQFLTPGTHVVQLRFNGRSIYGNGVDGPYDVKNLSIYSNNHTLTIVDLYTTGMYEWEQFEPAGVVAGRATVDGQPVPNASVFISGIDNDTTNADGQYRLTVLNNGNYQVNINAVGLGPWQIWVNGVFVGEGTSVIVGVTVGEVTEVNFVITAAHTVEIDIKPHQFPNVIYPGSTQSIVVAVFTTEVFDATTIDPQSVAFGPAGAAPKGGLGYLKDIDQDGDLDMVFVFSTAETGIQCGDTAATLTGQTSAGVQIAGSDSIVTLGCYMLGSVRTVWDIRKSD